MDLSTAVTMDVEDAAAMVKTYAAIPEAERTREDRQMLAGLRALKAGKTLIDVRAAIADGGLDEHGRPRLALARADWSWCHLHQHNEDITFSPSSWTNGPGTVYPFPGLFPERSGHGWQRDRRAMVPPIPPAHRPRKWAMTKRMILWEVEDWALIPRPPGDPALLRPISGYLCSIEHTWDLTDLERLVLAGRSHGPS